ncbi:hypothetical protein PBRA_007209 [Plasmodiophora brassicae]|uniref:VASt domain-containing protein n=1 Tax=Plasmodiophora brassicae TaxID=37360 RepID=A0A0G4IV15_PLABS|nr:hypothetical protein PBRA_007209 [Plasmodiophora brassicae]
MASSAADDARSQAVVQDAGGASPLQATAVTTTDGLAPSVSANGDERGSSAAGTDADLQMLKNRTFSLTFGVDEDLVDDFSCALIKSAVILFQGRMFVSSRHICFYSNFFSTDSKTLVIPFAEVDQIAKRNTAWVVPNAIEIHLRNGTSYFFGSVLSRNRCYGLLRSLWGFPDKSNIVSTTSSRDPSPTVTVIGTFDGSTARNTDCNAPPAGNVDQQTKCHTDDDGLASAEQSAPSVDAVSKNVIVEDNPLAGLEKALSDSVWGSTSPTDFTEVGRVELAVPVGEFFNTFYADTPAALSMATHLASIGAEDVHISPWESSANASNLRRTIEMCTRVKEICTCVSSSSSVHIRSQSSSIDVPYGDSFVVLVAYDALPSDVGCEVTARVALIFSRAVWGIKSVIVKQTIDGVRTAFAKWAESARLSLGAGSSNAGENKDEITSENKTQVAESCPPSKAGSQLAAMWTLPARTSGLLWRHCQGIRLLLSALIIIMAVSCGLYNANAANKIGNACVKASEFGLLASLHREAGNRDSLSRLYMAKSLSQVLLNRAICNNLGLTESTQLANQVTRLNGELRRWLTLERGGRPLDLSDTLARFQALAKDAVANPSSNG